MKIGLTGVHSTGKTTLLNALAGEEVFKDFKICNEVTRWVKSLGLPINEEGRDATQIMIALKHIHNLVSNEKMITDRTLLDSFVYATWAWERGQLTKSIYSDLLEQLNFYIGGYDFLFYIRPEFKIEYDGVRSTAESYHQEILDLFEQHIQYQFKAYHITGSVSDRVQQIKDIVLRELLK